MPRLRNTLLIIGFLLAASAAQAQTVPPPVRYVVAPETPGPNELVIIETEGVGSFLGSADFTWTVDGTVAKTGVGERRFTFTTKGLGERTIVRVAIDSSQGFFTQTFTFNPSKINLIWEADTSAPPLYLGKPLYSGGSDYKVVAFPTVFSGSSRIAPGALSYEWSYKGDPVPEASGLGRAVFSRTGDQLQDHEAVAVDVYYGSAKVGRAELFLPASEPRILFYQRDLLRGVLYDAAIPSAISLIGKEITVQAEPFYFSAATKASGLIPFSWQLNGSDVAGPDSARGILTLRQTGTGEGGALLGLTMENNNPDQVVQTAKASLQIVFGASSGGLLNFFGL